MEFGSEPENSLRQQLLEVFPAACCRDGRPCGAIAPLISSLVRRVRDNELLPDMAMQEARDDAADVQNKCPSGLKVVGDPRHPYCQYIPAAEFGADDSD